MTVSELIEALSEFPGHLPVWHDGGGDPFCMHEITQIEIASVPEGKKLMGHSSMPEKWVELG